MIKQIKKNIYSRFALLDEHTYEVLRKSFTSTMVKVAGIVIGIGVSIFLGRTLGAEGLGIINLSNRIINILIVIGLFGMRQVIIKEVAIAHNKRNWIHIGNVMHSAYWMNGLITLILTIIFILLSPWLANTVFHEPRLTYPLIIALIVMTPQVYSRVFSSALVGYRKIWQSNLVEQTMSIAVTAILLFVLWLLEWEITVNNVAITYALGRIVVTLGVGLYWKTLFNHRGKKQRIINQLLKSSSPLFWVSISTIVTTNADAIMLGWLGNAGEVGIYTVAAIISLLTSFFLQVTNAAISPKVASLFESGKRKELEKMIQQITKGLGIVGIIPILLFIFAGNYILSLWGSEFKEAYWILIILSIGQFFNIVTGAASTLLVMCGHEKTQKNISLIVVIVNLILNFFLIKHLGSLGAAIATAITLIGQNIAGLILAKTKVGISTISLLK